jgi:wobble nucleotide-excising tRNase
MISEITLPEDRFSEPQLCGLKKKNFIYGKNGTGKSSITKAILNQYEEEYDVRIFQGFNRIIEENGGLNTIALGKENTELQPKIEQQKREVDKLAADITDPKAGEENTYSRLKEAEIDYGDLKAKIECFYSSAASDIKNRHTDWTGANYDKRKFQQDINSATALSDGDSKHYHEIVAQQTIENNGKLSFKELQVDYFLEAVNDIITKNIARSALVVFDTKEKMNWAKQGLPLHKTGDKCAFCGSILSVNRLEELNSYFNNEVKMLETRIDKAISTINIEINQIQKMPSLDKIYFYPEFQEKVNELNVRINDLKVEYFDFLGKLRTQLQNRKADIFISLEKLEVDVPLKFVDQIEAYEKLFDENQKYNSNLSQIKKDAKNKLRLNEVAKKLKEYKYSEYMGKLEILEKAKTVAQRKFNNQRKELLQAKGKLKLLLSQTIDESRAAENINELLKTLGNQAFTLVQDSAEGKKGQYQVLGYDQKRRMVETLSTGEKNIVAFLWFLSNLENPNRRSDKTMVIVFDDPMNSNDDTVQYLIISKLQELLRNLGDRQIFILTHSVHFYLNVRYQWWEKSSKSTYDKTTYHLIKAGIKSEIKCVDGPKNDLKTSYDALWSEVKWLYDQHQPDFMLNPIRRIFETYQNFNGIKDMYSQDVEAQKLFNVNSHSIDDLEADLNGKDEVAIMQKVKAIFESVHASEHYKHYWKESD